MAGYQDFEANDRGLYSKASDMFSFGCVLFEIWTGACLLKYRCNLPKLLEEREYCRAYQKGRVVKLKIEDAPWLDSKRIQLKERAAVIGQLAGVLLSLIDERVNRITAEGFMTHKAVEKERQILVSKGWKLDNGKNNYLKMIFKHCNQVMSFDVNPPVV